MNIQKNMNGTTFEPAPHIEITDLETLKVTADPLRIQLLHLLMNEARTVKQAAGLMGVNPTKLYYHANLLEQHGLIRLVDTRLVSGIQEKYFRAAAYGLRVSPRLLTGEGDQEGGMGVFFDFTFDETRAALQRSLQSGLVNDDAEGDVIIGRRLARLTPQDQREFVKRLSQLAKEFVARGEQNGLVEDPQATRFFLLFFSMFPIDPDSTISEEDAST
ncbi:MAG: ArsR family transcriptional regulator [Anaerolineae bacterium]|nr:MAG: ArsR family transcriptional regulator [Anaerolineae bacterium]